MVITTSKTCRKCGLTKEITEFYVHKMMADGYLNFCRDCVKARVKDHREANDHVRAGDRRRYHEGNKKEQVERWQAQNRDRMRDVKWASQIFRRALRQGDVPPKPDRCVRCGMEGYVEPSHHDYTKPLEIEWLCRRCHRREDQGEAKTRSQIHELRINLIETEQALVDAMHTINLLLLLQLPEQILKDEAA